MPARTLAAAREAAQGMSRVSARTRTRDLPRRTNHTLLLAGRDLYAEAERRLGRTLDPSERAIDLARNDRILELGKAKLAAAVERERNRAIRDWVRGGPGRLRVTGPMLAILLDLVRAGERAAREEIGRIAPEERRFESAADRLDFDPRFARLRDTLRVGLYRIETRIHEEGTEIIARDIGGLAAGAVARAMERRVPGVLDTASRLVSPAFATGLGGVYDNVSNLFDYWLYTAVMDGATCDVCRAHDGERFDSWEAIQAVLPGGGPNPFCRGGSRCRCRAVPGVDRPEPLRPEERPPQLGDSVRFSGGWDIYKRDDGQWGARPSKRRGSGVVARIGQDGMLVLNIGRPGAPKWFQIKAEHLVVRADKPLRRQVGPLRGGALRRALGQTRRMIAADSAEALVRYTGIAYSRINGRLRSTRAKNVRDPEIQALDRAFDAVPALQEEGMVFRATGLDALSQPLSVGDVVTDRGFVSTSAARAQADKFRRDGDLWEIVLPKGAKALDVNALVKSQYGEEREILLPRGTRFVVESIRRRSRYDEHDRIIRLRIVVDAAE